MPIFAAFLVAVAGSSASPPDPTGLWRTPVDEGIIRIERCGPDICGRAAGSAHLLSVPDQKDVRNKDAHLRGRLIKNLLIFRLQPTGPGRWGKGAIYNPDDGGTYSAELSLPNPHQVRLKGCVVAPLCKTQTWTRLP